MLVKIFSLVFIVISVIADFSGCVNDNKKKTNVVDYSYESRNSYNFVSNFNSNYDYNFNNNFNYDIGPNISTTKTPVIGLAMAGRNSPYFNSIVHHAEAEAKKQGVELVVEDAEWDDQKQVEQINDFIRRRVDVVIIMPVDSKSLVSTARDIKEANIPLVNLNTRLDGLASDLVDTYVGVNATEQGELAAELMIEALGKKGGNVAVLEAMPNTETRVQRTKGFIDRLSQVNNIKITEVISAPLDIRRAKDITKDFLNQASKIDGIFVHDDDMAIGCIEATKEENKMAGIKFVGIGGSSESYNLIKKGELFGTITQPPDWEGTQAIRCIVDILHDKKIKVWYRDPVYKVTRENVEKFKGLW